VLVAFSISFFILLMSVVVGVAQWMSTQQPAPAAAVPEGPSRVEPPNDLPDDLPGWVRTMHQLGLSNPLKSADARRTRRQLVSAGLRDDWMVSALRGVTLALLIGLPAAALLFVIVTGQGFLVLVSWCGLAAFIGMRLPEWLVERRIKKRRQSITVGLPDLLDLLVISIESGLSLDSAIHSTAADLELVHPVISDELNVFQYELRAGKSRAEALRNLGARTGVSDMRKLGSLLIQADRFGTSVSKVLRTQARYMRLRRRQSAEEKAHKVGVKLIFPIFFLIMPTLFLVTVGPALLQLFAGISTLSNP
jgi:tight adherence protein C